jgi:capsular polysaccharide biosynthesis protein
MSKAGFKHKILAGMKRLAPAYRGVRWVRRQSRQLFFRTLRQTLPTWPRLGPAKGLFHALDELRAGRLTGEILLEGQPNPPLAPDSLRIRARLNQEKFQPWPIFWTRHGNARLIGETALLLDQRKRACAEAMFRHPPHDSVPDYHTLWLPRAKKLPGNWTSLLTRWDQNFYHWLTDCLPRLALLDRLPPDTRILVPAQLLPFQRDTLRRLGLEHRIEPLPGRHLVAENFYFSTPTVMSGCANAYGTKFLRDHFLPHAAAAPEPAEKIYIQRRGQTRGIRNEPELLAFLTQRGWRAVELESLSLAQQIGLFAGARAVCGLHGAGFTNLLWCRPGCVAVELLADNFLNGCYEALASCVGVEHRFLIQPADVEARLQVDLDQLARLLPD